MKKIKAVALLVIIVIFTLLSFQYLDSHDNKYRHAQAPIHQGVLQLEDLSLDQNQLYSLVDHWDYYNHINIKDTLDLSNKTSIYLGQYPDYSMRLSGVDPFGVSSYHLRLATNTPTTISMFIPEVDTAYEVWLDDTMLIKNGDIHQDPIASFIKNRVVTFTVDTSSDLYFIVGNSSYYYSGLYFPPVISSQDGITSMMLHKLLFYGFLCFTTLSIACYSMVLWIRNRKTSLYFLFGCAALSFSVYISIELWRFIGFSFVNLIYAINDLSYFIMMACILSMNAYLAHVEKHKLYLYIILPIAVLICILSLTNSFILQKNEMTLQLLGFIIDAYKYLSIAFVFYTSFIGLQKQKSIYQWIIAANSCYIIGIFYTLWYRNAFEPITYGWPNEYTSFAIIILFTIFMIRRTLQILKENEQLTKRLEETVEQRTMQLQHLLDQRKALLREFAHDVKAPISSIQLFVNYLQDEDIEVDSEVENYLNIIRQKSEEAGSYVAQLQHFSKADTPLSKKKMICIQQFLQQFYDNNKPDCDACAIYLNLELDASPAYVLADESQLVRVFENLLFNALDFTQENGHILIKQSRNEHGIQIIFEDDGIGIVKENLDKVFEKGISYRQQNQSEHGLGLYIAKSILLEHGGNIHVLSEERKGCKFIIQLPENQEHK